MCTVVVSLEPDSAWPVVLLGLRDEAVDRPWDSPGAWWPELPGVRGVRDREAGGAWLAVDDASSRAAVVLNRHEQVAEPEGGYTTRGVLPLEAVSGRTRAQEPTTRAFNLVTASPDGIRFTSWDGRTLASHDLRPGVHMITHEGPDVATVPRELRWLPRFREAFRPEVAPAPDAAPSGVAPASSAGDDAGSWTPWLDVLRESSSLPTDDDEALFRSDEVDGHRYASLSVSLLALRPGEVVLRHARLPHPGHLEGPLDWQ
ncbi:NRDE family protein [Frondihabitans australicus]|uniref:Transport and Golgi organization protein 2 n=1 Tax=Frondihabitans australicus TaxID=386892 RepID=A0A495IL06_9MICO|nr:NRDE family protein [Frondihabitans australicus]RKR76654.1 transport and Golgi organization protein 2 [Frondihabitans australicus]